MTTEQFIKKFMSCSLIPYWNDNKELAIGYNQTINVTSASLWTQKQADSDLHKRIAITTSLIHSKVANASKFSANQMTALVSLFLDIGYEDIRRTKFMEYLETKNYVMISSSFMLFNKTKRNVVSVKKTARRKAEQTLFNSKD